MDQNRYKQTKTQRRLTYSYYWSPPAAGKPVLSFSHGFPSASFLWRKQVAFFEPRGYGILVPDHLGYGGTDKPMDPNLYLGSGLAQDMVDIFDAEGLGQVVAVGHEWGSRTVSRLLNYHPQRISAVAFVGTGYMPPALEGTDPITRAAEITRAFGCDVCAYMRFFVQPDASEIIEKHIDSFISLIYPESPQLWKDYLCVDGGAREYIDSGKTAGLPAYMTPEDKKLIKDSLLSSGLSGPLCWYRQMLDKTSCDDEAKITQTDIAQPLLFVAFTADIVGVAAIADINHEKYAKGTVTRREVAADHWGVSSHADEINAMLLEWLELV